MKTKVIIALLVLVLAAITCRFLWTLPSPIGVGRHAESPDKSLIAYASTFTSRSFFGGQREHYVFRIEDRERRLLRVWDVDPAPNPLVSWRDDGAIEWSGGYTVTYSAPGIRLTLELQ